MPIILGRQPGGAGGGGAPSGPAGGSLSGTYPNPSIAAGAVDTAQLAADSVDSTIIDGADAAAIRALLGTLFVSLFDSTLGGAAATIDTGANGVAQTASHLLISAVYRTSAAAETDGVLIRFNNDSSAIYDYERVRGTDATVSAVAALAATSLFVPALGNNALAGQATTTLLWLPAYTQTNFNKAGIAFVMQTDDTAGTQRSDIYAFGFRATGAITRVAITPNTGPNLNAGSRLSIYGVG